MGQRVVDKSKTQVFVVIHNLAAIFHSRAHFMSLLNEHVAPCRVRCQKGSSINMRRHNIYKGFRRFPHIHTVIVIV